MAMTAQIAGKTIERYPGSNRWLPALQVVAARSVASSSGARGGRGTVVVAPAPRKYVAVYAAGMSSARPNSRA